LQPLAIEALAAERDKEAASDIRMNTQCGEDAVGVVVRVAPRKPDELDRRVVSTGDCTSDMVRAFDEIDDKQIIPYALPTVTSQIAGKGEV
jgi:hypothetical protein